MTPNRLLDRGHYVVPAGRRRLSVGALGDSITVNNMPNVDYTNGGAAPTQTIISANYIRPFKSLGPDSFLMYGSMRGGAAWFPHENIIAASGAIASQIRDWLVPVFKAYPYGLPDACVVLAGSNDCSTGVATATSINACRDIYKALIDMGVLPIAMTIPPQSNFPKQVYAFNAALIELCRSMGVPCANVYNALVKANDGTWFDAAYTVDGVHFLPAGAALAGYVLNQTISAWFNLLPNQVITHFDDAATTYTSRDPNFLTVTGAVNGASSYPSLFFLAPNPLTMATVFNSAGVEPGVGHTMRSSPTIAGVASTPKYDGNSYSFAGDGVNTMYNQAITPVPYAVGDKIAFSFRIKLICDITAAHKTVFALGLNQGGNFIHGLANFNGAHTANIGSEAAFPAGEFYQETTVTPGTNLNLNFAFEFDNGNGASNASDSATIANLHLVNLTKGLLLY